MVQCRLYSWYKACHFIFVHVTILCFIFIFGCEDLWILNHSGDTRTLNFCNYHNTKAESFALTEGTTSLIIIYRSQCTPTVHLCNRIISQVVLNYIRPGQDLWILTHHAALLTTQPLSHNIYHLGSMKAMHMNPQLPSVTVTDREYRICHPSHPESTLRPFLLAWFPDSGGWCVVRI